LFALAHFGSFNFVGGIAEATLATIPGEFALQKMSIPAVCSLNSRGSESVARPLDAAVLKRCTVVVQGNPPEVSLFGHVVSAKGRGPRVNLPMTPLAPRWLVRFDARLQLLSAVGGPCYARWPSSERGGTPDTSHPLGREAPARSATP
jgi:hypothetical protein